jgi:hypothetical protein
MMNNFALFLCCIVKPKSYESSDLEISLYNEDHYIRARNFCTGENAFLANFNRNDLVYYVMKHAKNNRIVMESVLEFMNDFYSSIGNSVTPKFNLIMTSSDVDNNETSEENTTLRLLYLPVEETKNIIEELSGETFSVPHGMPSTFSSLSIVAEYLLPRLKHSDQLSVLYYALEIGKKDYKGFLQKSKPRAIVVTNRSISLYKEGNQKDLKSILTRSNGCTSKEIHTICAKNGTGTETRFCEEMLFEGGITCVNYSRKDTGPTGSFTSSATTNRAQVIVTDALGKKKWIIEGKRDVIRELCYVIKFVSFSTATV